MRKLLLTFDVEDFINSNEMTSVYLVLNLLSKHNLKALFFITGHVAEKLAAFPQIIDLLKNHEIGFHSSAHSVHPTIPEYTDIESYERAYEISLERESSHINPLTGKIEGEGGTRVLQHLFKSKKILAFRAPGMSWTPPNLEALVNLGIRFDFSSNITHSKPIQYKGVTFYPYTFIQNWAGSFHDYEHLVSSLLKRELSIFDLHPTLFVNQREWDSIYYQGNPLSLSNVPARHPSDTSSLFKNLDLFLKRLSFLQQAKLLETDPSLGESTTNLQMSKEQVEKVYRWSMRWPRNRFHYKPRFLRNHFYQFFESAINS